ncbi:TolB family protein [Cylindrospermum sp. FACHB-282]|uniref:TolB family protein n=1 Tax=Cylindrospermum sp. FACHB-282 TaxID=2692794 RepID=UPI0035CCDB2A
MGSHCVGRVPRLKARGVETPKTALTHQLPIALFLCSSLLTGCFGYPRLLSYPFDPGGRGLNSLASELNPQISGRYIVFISDRRGSQDVYLFDTLTRNLVDLPGINSLDAIATHPSVSEDGRYVVFASSRQGRKSIFLYDRETRQSRNLTANLPAEVGNPTISADGSRIAFESSDNGQWDVLVYDRFGRPLNIPQDPR